MTGAEFLKDFQAMWVAMLWKAMHKSGEGYRRPSVRRTGEREYDALTKTLLTVDRRYDKTIVRPANPTRFEPRTRRSERAT